MTANAFEAMHTLEKSSTKFKISTLVPSAKPQKVTSDGHVSLGSCASKRM